MGEHIKKHLTLILKSDSKNINFAELKWITFQLATNRVRCMSIFDVTKLAGFTSKAERRFTSKIRSFYCDFTFSNLIIVL